MLAARTEVTPRPFEYNTANLIESLSFYGERQRIDGLTLITAPVSHAAFNVAIVDTPAADETELLFRVNAASNHFGRLDRKWNFYACEDMLDPRSARHLDALLDPMGMVRILDAPGMEAEQLDTPRHRLPELRCAAVKNADTRGDFGHLISAAFSIPAYTATVLYEQEERWHGSLRAWVGYSGDKPVCCGAAVEHAGVLGVYSVATLQEHRRKGYAEAIVRHIVAEYRRRGFAGPLVLQSTPDGRRLYREMGFTRTTRFAVYATI